MSMKVIDVSEIGKHPAFAACFDILRVQCGDDQIEGAAICLCLAALALQDSAVADHDAFAASMFKASTVLWSNMSARVDAEEAAAASADPVVVSPEPLVERTKVPDTVLADAINEIIDTLDALDPAGTLDVLGNTLAIALLRNYDVTARASIIAKLPAQVQLILANNPGVVAQYDAARMNG